MEKLTPQEREWLKQTFNLFIVPRVDAYCAAHHPPLEVDDKAWAAAKELILKVIDQV